MSAYVANLPNSEPGYWSKVFMETVNILRQGKGVSPDDAFLMGRHIVDEGLEKDTLLETVND